MGCFSRNSKLLTEENKEATVKQHHLELKSEVYHESSKEESFQAFDSLRKETFPDGTSITRIYGGIKASGISQSRHEANNQISEQKIDSTGKENKQVNEQISTSINTVNESTVKETKNLFIWIFACVIAGLVLYFFIFRKKT
jgi:hypothetical protein